MEVIIKGRRTQVEKETCLNGINESISETLAAGTPDIRRVSQALTSSVSILFQMRNSLFPNLLNWVFREKKQFRSKKILSPYFPQKSHSEK